MWAMDVPIEIPAGQQWPPGSLDLDRVTHPNGKRYLFVNGGKRDVCIFVQGFVVDLPVYKELRGRIYGLSAIVASAQTFDPKNSRVDNAGPPANDVTRFVHDAIIDNWSSMCDDLRGQAWRATRGRIAADGQVSDYLGHPAAETSPLAMARGVHAVDARLRPQRVAQRLRARALLSQEGDPAG